jgi:uncharacterized delta-60 repeat protein
VSIIERAKNICLTPATEWPVIAAEPTSPGTLVSGYVAPLAAIGAIAGFIGGSVIGRTLPLLGTYRVPFVNGFVAALFTFCMAIAGVFILSLIINALAPTFGGQQNSTQALKVAVYSFTPAWIAGVLQIVPVLGIFAIFAALYGLYLLYLGLPRLMKCPEDKAVAYTAVVVVCAIVLFAVVGMVGGMITGVGSVGSRAKRRGGEPERSLAVQANGKIVAGGYADVAGQDFALIRYQANGGLDPSFGLGGKTTSDFSTGSDDSILALVIQPNGKIVGVGYTDNDFALARYDK